MASVTADLISDSTLVKAGANANEIIYPQMSVTGLGDYSRNSGYTEGSVNLVWKSATFNYDRGTIISVDVMDNEESRNLAFGMAGATLMREKVAPEADAFTFAQIAGTENISVGNPTTFATPEAFLAELIAASTLMDEDEVPEEGRMLYATPTLFNSLLALDTYKSREVLNKFSVKKKVPQSRFYSAIDMLDGRSEDEKIGHYKKGTSGLDINFMIIHKPALIKFDKHIASNIIPASINPKADADISKYRKYGIVDVYKNKAAGIFLSTKAE